MILALALSSVLSAVPYTWILQAPHAARLLKVQPEDVAEGPVGDLTTAQLHEEAQRLDVEFPRLVSPIILLSLGGAGICGFGGLTYYFVNLAAAPGGGVGSFFNVLLGMMAGSITILAIAAAIVGAALLMRANNRRDAYGQRARDIAARLQQLEGPPIAPLPAAPPVAWAPPRSPIALSWAISF